MGIPQTHRRVFRVCGSGKYPRIFAAVTLGAVAEEEAFERATQVSPPGGHFCYLLVMHQACERDGFIDRP